MKKIYNSKSEISVIGTRHSEKLYETLVGIEEMQSAYDLGNYYKIPADNRDLNYDKYFTTGKTNPKEIDEYNSHNTYRLSEEELIQLLKKIGYHK